MAYPDGERNKTNDLLFVDSDIPSAYANGNQMKPMLFLMIPMASS